MTVKVSPKYQVVIPEEIRNKLDIKPGQMIQVVCYQNRIEYIPMKPIKSLRGYLKGMNTDLIREGDRL